MSKRHLARATGAAILVSAVLALPACGGDDEESSSGGSESTPGQTDAAAPKGASTISVKATEYALEPSPTDGKAGEVTFDVNNDGEIVHEFVVIKTEKKADQLLEGGEADETGAVDEIGKIEPGKSEQLTVKLERGHYALICNLPGHYMPGGKPGMLADFEVR